MIYMRGPSRWETDFEKALLMAHIGPLVGTLRHGDAFAHNVQMTEALITNTSTFLAEPAWQEVLRSLIQGPPNSVADNSEIVIALHMLKANIPGYFKDVCTVICAPEPSSPVMIEQLTHSLTTLQRALVDWRERYQGILKSIPQIRMETMDYDRQCKVFATYLSCQMITNRLTGTLVPYATRRRLEAQTQMLVKEMLHMERRARERKSSALLFMAQTVGVAGSVKASLGLWLAGAGAGDDTRGGRIGDEKMKGWCGIMGRKYM